MERKDKQELYVVGIGSSAGGLDALKSFFNGVKSSENLAFVIIQHQNPEHKTLLPKLLAKNTNIPIKIIEGNESIEPQIYVAPPGRNVEIKGGKFILSPPSGGYSPSPSVDFFFESLGNQYGMRSYGVILSGTGSDGSIGIRTIKSEDGIVFAQDLDEAAYDGMPSSAIETGIVDFVLPASSMAHEIDRLCSTQRDGILAHLKDSEDKDLNPIFTLLSEATEVDFRYYKPATVARRIERRMVATQNYNIKSYKEYIQSNHHEIKLLFKDLLIGVTSFFRDTEAFNTLREAIQDYIKKKSKKSLRIWSAGCSTGEEAYTLAILLYELLGEKVGSFNVNIFATDLDEDSIIKARKGIYPQSSFLKMDKKILSKYFIFKNGHFEATKKIRDMIIFSKHNLIKDPPFVKLDMISCRNMMIYMDQNTQKRLFEIFHYSLCPEGILFLGKSENASGETRYFKPISQKSKIFKRVAGIGKTPMSIYGRNKKPTPNISTPETQNSLEDEITQAIMDTIISNHYYSCVVLNENYELLYTQGDISNYLKLPQGRMNANIYKLINPSFSVELRAIITKALKDGTPATKHTIIKQDNKSIKVTIHAASIKSASHGNFIVLLFKEEDIYEITESKEYSSSDNDIKLREKELEDELNATREYLQTVVEELETSNEELQALNEELQASNEELQATNEEMETSNEELSSTNEELQSAYSELKSLYSEREEKRKVLQLYVDELKDSQKLLEAKNRELIDFQRELSQKEHMLNSIFQASNIGICITDEDGMFIKVNKAYGDIYGYSEDELIGNHFTKVVPQKDKEMAKKAHDDFIAGSCEIPAEWDVVGKNNENIKILATAARLHPEGDTIHKITTIMDITEYSKAQKRVIDSETKFRTIFNSTTGIIFIYPLNEALRPEGIVDANASALEFLGYSKKEIQALSIRDIIKDFDEKAIVELHEELMTNRHKTFKKQIENADGNLISAQIDASLINIDGKNSVLMIAREISKKENS
ncbi:MAG: CheR family methyltransferase [Campylobacterales bacterium]